MARSVSKQLVTSTILGLDPTQPYEVDDNKMPLPNLTVDVDGKPSDRAALITLQKAAGHKNVMHIRTECDIAKVALPAHIFLSFSEPCVAGATYGREYVTQVVKIPLLKGFAMTEVGMVPFCLVFPDGPAAESKYRKFVAEQLDTHNLTITDVTVVESRRFMTRDAYADIAGKYANSEVLELRDITVSELQVTES